MSWIDLNERDERRVAAFMTRVAALPSPPLPSDAVPVVSQLWWKAQLLRQWDAERRVAAPLDFMQPVEIAAGVACAAFLLYRAAPYLF